jgi:hypothetical protein
VDRRNLTRAVFSYASVALALPSHAQTQPAVAQRFALTPAETKAGVRDVSFDLPPGHVRRYGALGDGLADDTEALGRALAVVNAGQGTLQFDPGAVHLCGPLPAITADDVLIDARGATIKVKPGSWQTRTDGSTHLLVTGKRARLSHLVLDGNQHAFTQNPTTGRLLQFGDEALLLDVTVRNSAAQGARSGAAGGLCIGCHFDDNANVGMELDAASNLTFSACTWNRNGYGFGKSLDSNAFAAFGLATRFRSHHLTFESCAASQNGRDGIAIGQGSYACKLICCVTGMNGDGGFTIHSDLTTGGRVAGDGESCRDLEYIDCESYGNYGSGLVAFTPVYDVTVSGGRYYNNHRLAGSLPFQSSYPNGLFFASGSRGIRVRTKAYDDRARAVITGVTGQGSQRELQVRAWTAGSRGHYPKVVFHDADGSFRGYGLILADSTERVSVSSLPHNGVDLARISIGWRVSQRVQHNGCFLDNDCQGEVAIDGFGFLPGPVGFTGWKTLSGYLKDGQNVRLIDAVREGSGELLENPGFDTDIRHWATSVPAGGTAQHHQGDFRRSAGALELSGGTLEPTAADGAVTADCLRATSGTFVECTVWCHARAPGGGGLQLIWHPEQSSYRSVVEHPGGGWRCLTIGAFIPSTATRLFPRLYAAPGNQCFFDTASLSVKAESTEGRDT